MFSGNSSTVQYNHRTVLAMSFGVALLLNALLLADFYWTALITASLRNILLAIQFGAWIALMLFTAYRKQQLDTAAKSEQYDETFRQVICCYLRGDWFGAELLVFPHLEKYPNDIEMLLLQATMYRHTKRYEEATLVLDKVCCLPESRFWCSEVESEQALLVAAQNEEVENRTENTENAMKPILASFASSLRTLRLKKGFNRKVRKGRKERMSNLYPARVYAKNTDVQPAITPGEKLCLEAEILAESGLEPQEIAEQLDIPCEVLDLLLQIYQNIDTITGTDSIPPENVSVVVSEPDDSDRFMEADETPLRVIPTAKTEDTKRQLQKQIYPPNKICPQI